MLLLLQSPHHSLAPAYAEALRGGLVKREEAHVSLQSGALRASVDEMKSVGRSYTGLVH